MSGELIPAAQAPIAISDDQLTMSMTPAMLFQEIQSRIVDAFHMQEMQKDAKDFGISFWHHDLDGRWWIAHPDGSMTEHFQ